MPTSACDFVLTRMLTSSSARRFVLTCLDDVTGTGAISADVLSLDHPLWRRDACGRTENVSGSRTPAKLAATGRSMVDEIP